MYHLDSVSIIRPILCKVKWIHKISSIPFDEDSGGFSLFLCEMHKDVPGIMCKCYWRRPIDRTSVLAV